MWADRHNDSTINERSYSQKEAFAADIFARRADGLTQVFPMILIKVGPKRVGTLLRRCVTRWKAPTALKAASDWNPYMFHFMSVGRCFTLDLASLGTVEAWRTYFEMEVVHGFFGGAVDGSLGGELQRVKEFVTLDLERTAQLQQGVTDSTRPVVHQLDGEGVRGRGGRGSTFSNLVRSTA